MTELERFVLTDIRAAIIGARPDRIAHIAVSPHYRRVVEGYFGTVPKMNLKPTRLPPKPAGAFINFDGVWLTECDLLDKEGLVVWVEGEDVSRLR